MAKQISEEEIEVLVDRLLNRVYKANEYYLKEIGKIIKKVKQLSPSKAQQLIQILKYGGKYEEIVKQLNKYTNLNIKDIDKIFSEYAKKDQLFYEQFYKYRNMPFIKYDENAVLKMQTEALSNVAKNEMYNFTRSNVLGYSIRNEKGILQFTGLRETYNMVLDDALMNVSQGKETFDSAISRILADLGTSGIRTLNYESGRNVRLDSTVRMHLKSRLRELHNENQKLLGKEFGADGIEISVHLNPAPDHEEVQGRQFSNEEYDKLDNGDYAVDYKGNRYTLDHDGKNGYRPISEMNCYHTISSVILGVSPPEYTDLELKRIREDNLAGFEFEGKHYTNYEGTQLQSSLERAIREQKDIQILAKESGNEELIDKSQKKITMLTNKYRELSKQSGLPTSMERLRVSGYRRTKVINNYKEIEYARENNKIWHSTERIDEILESNKLETPSISVGKNINKKVNYGTQYIEFEPTLLENVDKKTILYRGDGGNVYLQKKEYFDNLMEMLKDNPSIYNELKFNNDLESLKYIKKVYIRQDEPKEIIDLLKKNNIDYEIYKDYRERPPKRKRH